MDAPNVVVTAVKRAEDDDGVIVRWYEFAGKQTDVHLTLPREATVEATNLMEQSEGAVSVSGTMATVPTKPYEIKTVKVTFK